MCITFGSWLHFFLLLELIPRVKIGERMYPVGLTLKVFISSPRKKTPKTPTRTAIVIMVVIIIIIIWRIVGRDQKSSPISYSVLSCRKVSASIFLQSPHNTSHTLFKLFLILSRKPPWVPMELLEVGILVLSSVFACLSFFFFLCTPSSI